MKHRVVFFAILLVSVIGWSSAPLQAQSNDWSTPFELSPPRTTNQTADPEARKYGSSWFPDMALGLDGSVNVVWYSGIALGGESASSLDLLMYRRLLNGQWSKWNEIVAPATGGLTVRNSIVAGRDGKLHVIFRSGVHIEYVSAPWDEAWSAQAWSEPKPISSGASYYTALATDSKGGLHAFWSEAIPDDPLVPNVVCSDCADLFYRRSTDGGNFWTSEVNLSRTVEGENRPQVKVDQNDRIHVVWDEGVDWYAGQGQPKAGIYRRSDDGGISWTDPISFTLPSSAVQEIARRRAVAQAEAEPTATPFPDVTPVPQAPSRLDAVQQTALALDAESNPFVVFRGVENDRVYFQRSPDGGATWSEATEIPAVLARDLNDNNLDAYSMATDGAGNIHLLLVGFVASEFDQFDPTNPSLLHLIWNGAQWSAPEVIVRDEFYPEYPRVAIFEGNQLHVVWFTRSLQDLFRSERAHYRIWYSTKQINAPSTEPLPLFTPVPTAMPTQTPTPPPPTPTPTPLPEAILQAPPLTTSPAWEGPGLQVLGLALLPLVGFLGLIFVGRSLLARYRDKRRRL
ncbi:MAG: glycoside hydrolase [Chloroflexales bacterium]|nr:glycoside hydrolase [Chloroflexales bacterium]